MKRVEENDDTYPFVFNIEDYTKQTINGLETIIRHNLILDNDLRDFNRNGKSEHSDYKGSEALGDIAFVNTTKIRTRQPNLTLKTMYLRHLKKKERTRHVKIIKEMKFKLVQLSIQIRYLIMVMMYGIQQNFLIMQIQQIIHIEEVLLIHALYLVSIYLKLFQ